MGFARPQKTQCELLYLPASDRIIIRITKNFGFTKYETERGLLEPRDLIDFRRGFLKKSAVNPVVVLDEWTED